MSGPFTFIIYRPGVDPIEVSARGLSQRLAEPTDIGSVLGRLHLHNTLEIQLREGSGFVKRRPQAHQGSLSLVPFSEATEQDYLAKATVTIRLPALIACRGRSEDEVKDLVLEIVGGRRGLPRGFNLGVPPEALDAVEQDLKDGKVEVIDHVDFIEVCPRQRLLTHEADAVVEVLGEEEPS